MTWSQNTINCNQLDHVEIQGKSSTSTKIRAVSVDNNETVTDSISAQTKDAPTEKSQETITRKRIIQYL